MAGNVWEWVADWYDEYDEGYYSSRSGQNPTGPSSGTSRVLRGGCWDESGWGGRVSLRTGTYNDMAYFGIVKLNRASTRTWSLPASQFNYLGFRCARDGNP